MFEKIAAMLSDQLNVPLEKITLESAIVEDLGADSLDVVELLMALEEETGKTIPEDKITEIKTVGDLVDVIAAL
ncbi:MAG: acyl carrier protein [Clostridia bacterium]|nr:acyl carrier protein [Clostridia bacterium]